MKPESPEHHLENNPNYFLLDEDIDEIQKALMREHYPTIWMSEYGVAFNSLITDDQDIIKLCCEDREACIDAIREKLIRGLH